MIEPFSFFVEGTPVPQGSLSYKGHRGGRPIITADNRKQMPWRQAVASAAREAYSGPPIETSCLVDLDFIFEAPKSRPRTQFLPEGRINHTVKPDLDKLVRAALDAISANVKNGAPILAEDSQVSDIRARKREIPNRSWPNKYRRGRYYPGAQITIYPQGQR